MVRHAQRCAPEESCGLIVGSSDGVASRVHCLTNAEPGDRRIRYLIDGTEQLRVMRDAEEQGLDVIGAFHSHVRSPAYPSETDINLAAYPEWIWVIISLGEQDPVVRAFAIADGGFEDVPIELL